jgi:hypothetical protein
VARWFLTYQNSPAALTYAVVTILTFAAIAFINFAVPTGTRMKDTLSEAESAERDAQRMDEGKFGEGEQGSLRALHRLTDARLSQSNQRL